MQRETLSMRLQLLLVIVVTITGTAAFGTGAPEGACGNLTPGTQDVGGFIDGHVERPQPDSTFPYSITCRRLNAKIIKLEVEGNFKGLLAQVRDKNDVAVGKIKSLPEGNFRRTCNDKGVTHRNSQPKNKAVFTIEVSRADKSKDLECVVTVVKSKNEYWVAHTTPVTGKNNGALKSAGREVGMKQIKVMQQTRRGPPGGGSGGPGGGRGGPRDGSGGPGKGKPKKGEKKMGSKKGGEKKGGKKGKKMAGDKKEKRKGKGKGGKRKKGPK